MNINKTTPLADRFLINEISYCISVFGEKIFVIYGFAEINDCRMERLTVANRETFINLMKRNPEIGNEVIAEFERRLSFPIPYL